MLKALFLFAAIGAVWCDCAQAQGSNGPLAGQCVIRNSTITGTVNQDCSVNMYGVGLPSLKVLGRKDDGNFTVITFEISGPFAPGHVTVRADTDGIQDAELMPVT